MTFIFSPRRDEDESYRISRDTIRYENEPLLHALIESRSLDGLACELTAHISRLGKWSVISGSRQIALETEFGGKIEIPFRIASPWPLEDEPTVDIMALFDARNAAKMSKDFKRADSIRDELKQRGWMIEDGKSGPRLKKAKP